MRTLALMPSGALLLTLALGACSSMPTETALPAQRADGGPPGPGGRPATQPAPASVPDQDGGPLETARRSVRSSAEWLARSVDGWFGDRPFTNGGSVTDGRLSVRLLERQDRGAEWSVRFNARLRLPNVEKGGYLFVGRDNRREVVADTPTAFSRQERQLPERAEDRSFFAGLGLALQDSVDLRLGLRGGLKPYAQARYRRPWAFGERNRVDFRQTLFWSQDERFGSTTALSYERALSSTLVLRWLNAATITQASRNFEWSTSLGAYKLAGDDRQFSVAALLSGTQGSGVGVSDYGVQAKWQQRVYKDWLLGEVSIGHFWPRPDDAGERSRTWAFGAGLEMRF